MAARSWASPGASAAWSPGLWTLGLAPASGDDVTIGGSATSYTVTLNIDSPAINSLTLGTNGGAGNATLDVGTHNLNVTGGSSDTITLLGSGLGSHLTIGGGTINANTLNIVSGDITGFGTITATVTVFADASLQASGGTLEVAGAVTDLGNGLTLKVGSASGDTLKLDGVSTAQTATFAGSSGTLELNTAATLTLASVLMVGANTVKLDGAGSTLIDSAGISLSTGTITGLGTVSGAVTAIGAGIIRATGGTLEVNGPVTDSGGLLTLAISGSGSTLLLDGVSSARTVQFSGSSGTLELNTAGALTLGTALAIGTNTLKLDGNGAKLTDAGGVTLSAGTITGAGKVAAAVTASGPGRIGASGGILEMAGLVNGGSSLTLMVGAASGDTLMLDSASTARNVQFLGSNGTLELNTSAVLSLGTPLALGANTLKLDGSGNQLTVPVGITIAGGIISGTGRNNADISGYGTISSPLLTGNDLTASGGTLEVTGTIIDSGSALTLTVGGASGDTLKLDGASAAQTLTFAGSAGTLELNGSSLTLGTALAVGGNTVKLDVKGVLIGGHTVQLVQSVLTDASGLTLSTGTVTGAGTVAGAITASGAGQITATGGTLEVTGAVTDSGGALTLTVGGASGDTLKLDGTSAAQTVTFANGSGGTLELGTGGSLTLGSGLNVFANTVKLDGATLTDAGGISLTSGTIIGAGTVASDVAGYGNIDASGGTLEIAGAINNNNSSAPLYLTIGSASGDTLKLDGSSSAQHRIAVAFAGSSGGTLELGASAQLTIGGPLGATALTVAANTLKLDGSGNRLTDVAGVTLAGGTISGTGNLYANISGYGTISSPLITGNNLTATGGTLEVTGPITDAGSALTLTVGGAAGDTLKLDGTSAAQTVTFSNGSGGTLELGTAGSLTLGSALVVGGNAVKLDGSGTQLTDSLGITLAGGAISGTGNVNGNISGYGTISSPLITGSNLTATGGTLEVTGPITDAGSALTLTVGGAAGDTLKLDGTSAAQTVTFANGSGGTLELGTAGSLTLGSALVVGGNALKLDGSGTQLTDPFGIDLAGGAISGTGNVDSNISGYGTISSPLITGNNLTATGGTLEVTGPITDTGSALTVAFGGASGDTLKLDGVSTLQTLTFAGSAGTLELNGGSSLTLGTALAVGGNTVKLDVTLIGGHTVQTLQSVLTDASGITLAGGAISGPGNVNGNISGYGTISSPLTTGNNLTATGGTLEVTGPITDTGSALTVAFGGASGDTLKLDGVSTLQSLTFAGLAGTLELNGGSSLTLGTALAVGGNTVKLDVRLITGHTVQTLRSVLTDASGITLSTGTVIGTGTVAGAVTASGAGQITATGGTLEVTGAVTDSGSALTLTVGGAAGDTLKLDGTSAAQTVTFAGSNGTLELNTAASLTLGAALALGTNTLELDGSGTQFTDPFGINLAGGAISGSGGVSTTTGLGGYGSVSTTWDIADTVTVSGGTLAFSGQVGATNATDFHIAAGSGNVLTFLAQVGTASVHPTITFDGSGGVLDLSAIGLSSFHGIIAGFGANEGIDVGGTNLNFSTSYNSVTNITTVSVSGDVTGDLLFSGNYAATNFQRANSGALAGDIVPCYCAGTRIATERGDVVVEELAIGDRVLTLDGELRPIKWIGRRSYHQPFMARSVMPILIKAGALRENVPLRDLYVSPEHAMYIDEVLVPAECLVNGVSIVRCADVATVQYFHIELDSHDVIFAEGAPAETFVVCSNRLMFHNAAEFTKLYPGDSSPGWAFCAPRVDSGPALEQIQRVIAERAGLASPDDAAACGPLEGSFDDASPTLINGWAFDPSQPHRPVWLEVLVNDGVIGRVLADKYRPDLAQPDMGDGFHGFALWLQQGLSPLTRHVIRVRRVADGCELPGSPRVLEACDAPDFLRSPELVQALRSAALGAADAEAVDQLLDSLRRGIDEVRQVRAEREVEAREVGAAARVLRQAKRGAVKARRALVIDDRLPDAARDAGSNAVLGHMRALMALGYRVEFVPARQDRKDAVPSDRDLAGVHWHSKPAVTSVEDVLRRNADAYELIYLHRLSNAGAYAGLARQWCPQAHIVYSVADLHHLRLARQAQLHDLPHLLARAESVKQSELHAMRGVDAVITHSGAEADYLAAQAPGVRVHVVPWPVTPIACNTAFAARAGLAFIGSVAHDPNIDAVAWLIQEIMPRVWRRDPAITCRIVGAGWPDTLRGYLDRRVHLVGAVPELASLFDQVRLTVAPLRFGAGIKGKVLDSLAAGVPCVMTPTAAEGLALTPSLRALIGQNPDQLANLIWRLHKDAAFNGKANTAGLRLIARDFSTAQVRSALQACLTRTELRSSSPTPHRKAATNAAAVA